MEIFAFVASDVGSTYLQKKFKFEFIHIYNTTEYDTKNKIAIKQSNVVGLGTAILER